MNLICFLLQSYNIKKPILHRISDLRISVLFKKHQNNAQLTKPPSLTKIRKSATPPKLFSKKFHICQNGTQSNTAITLKNPQQKQSSRYNNYRLQHLPRLKRPPNYKKFFKSFNVNVVYQYFVYDGSENFQRKTLYFDILCHPA